MNLIEALKTGRRIRMPGQCDWFKPDAGHCVSMKDALRTDWQVEPEPVKPLECWVNVYENGYGDLYHSAEDCMKGVGPNAIRIAVHMREVTE